MKKLFCLLICTLLLLYTTVTPDICTALPADAAEKTTETVTAEPDYAPDRIIIKLKKTARSASALASAEADLSSFCKEPPGEINIGFHRNRMQTLTDHALEEWLRWREEHICHSMPLAAAEYE